MVKTMVAQQKANKAATTVDTCGKKNRASYAKKSDYEKDPATYNTVIDMLKELTSDNVEELYDYVDFLLYRQGKRKWLDKALKEVSDGETETYECFDDFKRSLNNEV